MFFQFGVLGFVLWNLDVLLPVIEALNLVSPHEAFVLFVLRVSIFDFWVLIFVLDCNGEFLRSLLCSQNSSLSCLHFWELG